MNYLKLMDAGNVCYDQGFSDATNEIEEFYETEISLLESKFRKVRKENKRLRKVLKHFGIKEQGCKCSSEKEN